MRVLVSNISKTFANKKILNSISYEVISESITFFSGPSGCGKTTLLRIIAGLEVPDVTSPPGRILFDTSDVTALPAKDRHIGFFFQNYALWPHMTIGKNISFSHDIQSSTSQESASFLSMLSERLGLETLLDKYPHQLSGGQQQRVALARALASKPRLLLLDEPFSNLDHALRDDARKLVIELHKELRLTTIVVSHDPEDFQSIGTNQLLMNTL